MSRASPFVHLHVHSDLSPMRGVSSIEELCDAAHRQGQHVVALTDRNGLYGAIRFIEIARQLGLQPILGSEVVTESHRAVLLAKNISGYANLCRLLTARHCEPAFDLIEAVETFRDGLIILTDDLPSLDAWSRTSREDLYVEMIPGPRLMDALALCRRLTLPPVATNAVHFLHAEGFAVHRVLRAIAVNTTLSRLTRDGTCAPTQWLLPAARMARHFPHLPAAIENTGRIAAACRTDWRVGETVFPNFRRVSDGDAFLILSEKTYAGAVRRYGGLTEEIRRRIEYELALIREKGFAHYFLIVEDIVRHAPRTCGRGSVAASIVSYCLAITHVDPLRHHLFFERFLNPGRTDPPDIDIDFPWDERDAIIARVFEEYGGEQAAMVANHNTLGLRGALREVAKVYGIPAGEIGRVSALVMRQKDFFWFDTVPTPAAWASRMAHAVRLEPPWEEILQMAVLVQGHLRHLSLHCGGIVIVPEEIRQYVPVEIAAKGVPVIQWEKDQTEDAGLVKIDLLGNRSLAVIRDALTAVERHTGHRIEYAAWDPLDDPATQDLIRRGDTIGCFYIESPATRLLLKKLWGGMPADRLAKADAFEYLVMVSSLVRPATNTFVEEFIRRAHGHPYAPLHPLLHAILEETHGIMVYQEDVTKVAMALANFSVEDADQLRKVISKKHKRRQLRDYHRQFCRGAAANGVEPTTIAHVWEMIMSFAGYSFCKPHSASYAQVSFKCAYLRAHYPAEFLAAVISNEGGFYSTWAYLSEARRMRLTILPPDVNASEWAYTGAGQTLRVGLMQVKGLPRAFVDRLVAARTQDGPFRSFQDFLTRVEPTPGHARLLIRSGACDSIAGELTRPALLWRLHAGRCAVTALPVPDEYTREQRLAHEAETLGLLISCHPLELYRSHPKGSDLMDGCRMRNAIGQRVTMMGWLVTEKFAETRTGQPMEFATFEDLTALYDVTVFPETYRRFCHLLTPHCAYLLTGRIEQQFSIVTLTLEHVSVLGSFPPASWSHDAPSRPSRYPDLTDSFPMLQ